MRHSILFRFIVLLIICVCACPDSQAQITNERQKPDQIGGKGHTKPQQTTKPRPKPTPRQRPSKPRGKKSSDKDKPKWRDSKPRIGSDRTSDGMFVYYADVVKLNGWLVGVGEPLTVEQVRAGDSPYFKLSQMNAAGNWCLVESFDEHGHANDDHAIKPFFDAPVGDAEWIDDFEFVSKWEFIADSSGVAVVEERWLLADSSTVLSFHPIQIGEREILGLYTDKHGVPIYTYDEEVDDMTDIVCLVHIFRDEYGFDLTFDFFGADSIPEKYTEAASRLMKKFDKKDP